MSSARGRPPANRRRPVGRSVSPGILEVALPVIGPLLRGAGWWALSTLPILLAYLAGRQGFAIVETHKLPGVADIPLPPVHTYLNRGLARYLHGRRKGSPT